jgi:hypothetical protein
VIIRSWVNLGAEYSSPCTHQCLNYVGFLYFQELAQLIPDIGNLRVQDLPSYAGTRDSSRILYSARSQLEQLSPPDYSTELSYDPGTCILHIILCTIKQEYSFSFIGSYMYVHVTIVYYKLEWI